MIFLVEFFDVIVACKTFVVLTLRRGEKNSNQNQAIQTKTSESYDEVQVTGSSPLGLNRGL